MQEDMMGTQQLICDYVTVCGGVLKVHVTEELLSSVASARSRYRGRNWMKRSKRK